MDQLPINEVGRHHKWRLATGRDRSLKRLHEREEVQSNPATQLKFVKFSQIQGTFAAIQRTISPHIHDCLGT